MSCSHVLDLIAGNVVCHKCRACWVPGKPEQPAEPDLNEAIHKGLDKLYGCPQCARWKCGEAFRKEYCGCACHGGSIPVKDSPQPPKEVLKGIADKCGNCVCVTRNPGDCGCSCHVYTKAEIDEKFRRMLIIVQSYDKNL